MDDRQYWINTLTKIVEPVLSALCEQRLRKTMPVETTGDPRERARYTHLEAMGRSLCGLAPWLECSGLSGGEEQLRTAFSIMARGAVTSATDPASKDYVNFSQGYQPIVDAAFLCHAFLRAPEELWGKLEDNVKHNVIRGLKATRTRKPGFNNWLLFSALIEAFLYRAGEKDFDLMRIDYALRQHLQWYKGDGVYGDGPFFHFDYYNSFVIQPMLVTLLDTVKDLHDDFASMQDEVISHAVRYAEILERLIAPDGSYPVVGRSSAYRFGAFQHLAQMALEGRLGENLGYPQVRCALTAVIRKVMEGEGNFDENGWLRIGVYGHQMDLGEYYISTGSLYLCSTVFLPLGLPPSHSFWSGTPEKWTSAKIWSGENFYADHARDA